MAETILMPKLGLTMTEGTVDTWYKKEGDAVKKGEALCEISSEKLSQYVESESDGILLKILVPAGEEVPCKEPIGYVGQAGEKIATADSPKSTADKADDDMAKVASAPSLNDKEETIAKSEERIFISPLARKIAAEKGIDYGEITGTGGNGRITRRDVEAYKAPAQKEVVSTSVAPMDVGAGLKGMRKAIAKNMMRSLHSTAQLSMHRKVDVTELMSFRKELKAKIGDSVSSSVLSLNVFLIKAVSLALKDVPEMNAHYDGQEYAKKEAINIGVAVALDEGLIVPVIKNVHQMSLSGIAKEFGRVTTAAKAGNSDSADLQEGTFSITNLGSEAIEYFTPILNTPEVGILGIGTLSERLAFDGSREIVEIKELPLSLTFDHQVVDGAPAARFMKQVAYYLENPYLGII